MSVDQGYYQGITSDHLAQHSNVNRVRWMTLVGTIITQFALGSVYTWSLYNAGLAEKLGVGVDRVAFSFGILSLSLAVASSLSGKFQERFGVTKVTVAAGVLMGLGLLLTSMASNLAMLYIFAGFVLGFADGTGYLMTLSNCVRWFPESKGTISAFSIGAYGLGSLGFKYINLAVMQSVGLDNTFLVWGGIALVMVVVGGLLMKDAPEQKSTGANAKVAAVSDFSLAQAMKRPQYWMLALIFLTVCMSGLYVIGVAKDIGQQYAGLAFDIATGAVAVVAVTNLLGRLVLGILSDKMPRIYVVSIALIASLIGMCLLMFTELNATTYYIAVGCVGFSFGGTITVYPSLVSDFFGLNNLAKNYGVIYLGFGIGSLLASVIAAIFGGFTMTFGVILALLVVSLVISFLVRKPRAPEAA